MPEIQQEVAIVKRISSNEWNDRKAAGATDVYNGPATQDYLRVIAFGTADQMAKPDFNNPDIQVINDLQTVAALRSSFAKLFRDQGLQG